MLHDRRLAGAILVGAAILSSGALVTEARGQAPAAGPERLAVVADGHSLVVWARVPASPRGAVLLLNGRTWSARPDFDLQVPGLRRSVLASLAAQGFAAYALDQRGYGDTARDSTGWLTPKRAAADTAVVLQWIADRHPALPKPALAGWSLGAATAHLAAALTPAKMSALVLFGYGPDPDAFIMAMEDPKQPLREKNSKESAASDFISPKVTPMEVVRAFMDTAIKTDPILVDWKEESQFICDSARVTVPTLVIFGERDPGVDVASAVKFFAKLGTPDKQLVVLPGADHCAHLEDTHDAWIAALTGFLTRPAPVRR